MTLDLKEQGMNTPSSLNKGLAASLIFFSVLIAACGGGGGSSQFGTNSDVEVLVSSNDIEDLSVIVSPLEGGPDVGNACREDDSGFGCDVELFNDATQYLFKTNSAASEKPYHVYIRNFANATRRGTLDIWMEEELEVSVGFEVFANETFFIARIFRNNADFNDTNAPDNVAAPRILRTDAEKNSWMRGDNEAGVPLTNENFREYVRTKRERPQPKRPVLTPRKS
jgi:hypothetical protein